MVQYVFGFVKYLTAIRSNERTMIVDRVLNKEALFFSHKPSIAMVRFCSESTLLKKEDITPFIKARA
jgi:hypothetical protein